MLCEGRNCGCSDGDGESDGDRECRCKRSSSSCWTLSASDRGDGSHEDTGVDGCGCCNCSRAGDCWRGGSAWRICVGCEIGGPVEPCIRRSSPCFSQSCSAAEISPAALMSRALSRWLIGSVGHSEAVRTTGAAAGLRAAAGRAPELLVGASTGRMSRIGVTPCTLCAVCLASPCLRARSSAAADGAMPSPSAAYRICRLASRSRHISASAVRSSAT